MRRKTKTSLICFVRDVKSCNRSSQVRKASRKTHDEDMFGNTQRNGGRYLELCTDADYTGKT